MKKVIVVYLGDVFDAKEDLLEDQTPLEAAETPFLDHIYSFSYNGSIANPNILDSYAISSILSMFLGIKKNQHSSFYLAKGMDCELKENDIIFKNNFVSLKPTAKSLSIMDPSGASLSVEEKLELTELLNSDLYKDEKESFYLKTSLGGDSVLVYSKENLDKKLVSFNEFHSPYEFVGREIDVYPKMQEQSKRFMYIMNESQMLMSKYPVVIEKSKDNFFIPNSIWFHEGSFVESLNVKFPLHPFKKSIVLSPNLIMKGFASTCEMQYLSNVENYTKTFEENDFVFLDKEMSDKQLDPIEKVNEIQVLDKKIEKIAEQFANVNANILFLFNYPYNMNNEKEKRCSFLLSELKNGMFKLPQKKFTTFDLLCIFSNAISLPDLKSSGFIEGKFGERKNVSPMILGSKLFKN
jgi:2,3-bisphosphoglycerate-independent phosphoglycerate mutase